MVDNDEIGGLVVDNEEIGGHDRKMSEQVLLSNSQSEFEQEHEFFNHAEMHGGGGAKRARKQSAKIVSIRTDDAGKCTQTVLRGEALSYRTLEHTPGGTLKIFNNYLRLMMVQMICAMRNERNQIQGFSFKKP